MKEQTEPVKHNLGKRLRRIEGQLRGIQKMVDEDRDCREIVQQMNAAQSALHNASVMFLRNYAKDCLLDTEDASGEERELLVDEVISLLARN